MQTIQEAREELSRKRVAELLDSLIQTDRYVGEVISLSYDEAIIQVHDHYRHVVGGLPAQCFLIATRKWPGPNCDWDDEDACVILLRVQGPAALPHDAEAFRIRAEAAQNLSEQHGYWDRDQLDLHTRNLLSFAGLKCRVLGTFYVDRQEDGTLVRRFGADISNYYAAYALKVYKPSGKALEIIANYRDPDRLADHPLKNERVEIGRVRYASTDRKGHGVDTVRISIAPTDLLRQKTALFGMTRTGKSNTTKIIAKTLFELRYRNPEHGRIGQLIFDYNGEYANENVQDRGALKNVWRLHSAGVPHDVVTYGTEPHPNDPDRRLMKVNFYLNEMLPLGKRLIDDLLANEKVRYVEAFRRVSVDAPLEGADQSTITRHRRRCLAYRALLSKAGFEPPEIFKYPRGERLFNRELIEAMRNSKHTQAHQFADAAQVLERVSAGQRMSWDQLAHALAVLYSFITMSDTGYEEFNRQYMSQSSSGSSWADEDFLGIIGMLAQRNGPVLVKRALNQHTSTVNRDFADMICEDLHKGRLVIVDQSLGNTELNRLNADRVMEHIFRTHQRVFSGGQIPPDIIVYVEEAHNLLPSGTDFDPDDSRSIWPRVAKEGAKLHIGLVYATQEVSSIHRSVLKNTANWFIGHLNNTDETRELVKFYDFADYQSSILRGQDPGFIRVKTLSNPYVVPAQIDRFYVETVSTAAKETGGGADSVQEAERSES
ncbi:MAG: ATP-binding protein [Syntrophothermus sp.]|nr:ATP-binding protein [Syntrophothermus sp.]